MLVYDKNTGLVLGGQTTGYQGADKRLDVIATAAAAQMTIHDLADVDFAYSPPIGTANDALNMAAYTAQNKQLGFSDSVTVAELDALIAGKKPLFIDVRDFFAYEKNHIEGAENIPLELIASQVQQLPTDKLIVIYDETGKKGHQALRTLKGAGFAQVVNISGGFISLERHALTQGFQQIKVALTPIAPKSLEAEKPAAEEEKAPQPAPKAKENDKPLVIDVRTVGEFRSGAYPDAINIPLDDLTARYAELGDNPDREITVYCASGARSAYAESMLKQIGYKKVTNGGGLTSMMSRLRKQPAASKQEEHPLVIDVRTVQEFKGGAYPKAINIPLDELPNYLDQIGSLGRDLTVYCASGARSSYAQNFLKQNGFTNVKNGGGLMQMMMKGRKN
jgi:rhodanese-related sulfurtransferase